jgi:hypothetical protein
VIIAKGSGALLPNAWSYGISIKMRIAKSPWAVVIAAGMLIVVALTFHESRLMAQLPTPNPLVAPLPPPSGPPTLTAPGSALAAPSLAAVPTLLGPSPTPAARAFNCSCYGPAEGTSWMGQVSAAGYFAAKQTATTACLTYNQQKEPALAAVAPADGVVPLVPQGFASPDVVAVPSSVATTATLPGAASITTTAQQTACERCVCN